MYRIWIDILLCGMWGVDMSLKKRMFWSNMRILFLALFSLMAVLLLVLVIFEDSFERQLGVAGREGLESLAGQAARGDVFGTFFLAVLVTGAAAIGVLLLLASVFTRKLTRVVMEPVELLVAAAERIQEGNLEEEIVYRGEAEFEHVCRVFNGMQRTMRKDREQRARNERARIDMVTGISHDLRTPLTSIQGYIKGVLDGVAGTEEKRETYLKTALEAAQEMNVLLQKLFDFSRMESGQLQLHLVPVDLAEYTAAYVAQKEAALETSEVRISFRAALEVLPEVMLDVEQMRRIFDNLLENSRKYAGVRPVCIDVSLVETRREIVLQWKDNGAGVPEDKLPRIFERFYRCDESRKEKGSGIGLSVVQYLMERHHGRVTAQNEGGLKLCLYFPKVCRKEDV